MEYIFQFFSYQYKLVDEAFLQFSILATFVQPFSASVALADKLEWESSEDRLLFVLYRT